MKKPNETPRAPRVPPEELVLNCYTQDELRIIARRCLEPMWLSGKAEILQEITADLVKRALGDHW